MHKQDYTFPRMLWFQVKERPVFEVFKNIIVEQIGTVNFIKRFFINDSSLRLSLQSCIKAFTTSMNKNQTIIQRPQWCRNDSEVQIALVTKELLQIAKSWTDPQLQTRLEKSINIQACLLENLPLTVCGQFIIVCQYVCF